VVMSATLDTAPVAAHLGCPVVRSEGRLHPVEIDYRAKADDRRMGEQVAAAVRKLTVPGTSGDVLVFLPGAAEHRHAQDAVAALAQHRSLPVLPRHCALSGEARGRHLAPARA